MILFDLNSNDSDILEDIAFVRFGCFLNTRYAVSRISYLGSRIGGGGGIKPNHPCYHVTAIKHKATMADFKDGIFIYLILSYNI